MSGSSVRPPRGSLAERVARRIEAGGAAVGVEVARARGVPAADPPSVPPMAAATLTVERPDTVVATPEVAEALALPATEVADAGVHAQALQTPDPINVDFARLNDAGFITPDTLRSGQAEELRVIKQQLLKIAFTEDRRRRSPRSNVIMVTSSIPGEGKTFVSLNLAIGLSVERDTYVLLVDADSHRKHLSELMCARTDSLGLLDLVHDDKLQLPQIMHRTNIPNLTFVPAGRPYPHGAEMLASKKTGALMADIAARYPDRIVVIDTPPLLASTEGAALSAFVGHVVVIVEKDRTSMRSLRNTLDMLRGCENISCILNFDGSGEHFSRYAYGY